MSSKQRRPYCFAYIFSSPPFHMSWKSDGETKEGEEKEGEMRRGRVEEQWEGKVGRMRVKYDEFKMTVKIFWKSCVNVIFTLWKLLFKKKASWCPETFYFFSRLIFIQCKFCWLLIPLLSSFPIAHLPNK